MANISIKTEKTTQIGEIFHKKEQFDLKISSIIDSTIGLSCKLCGCYWSMEAKS